MPFEMIGDEGGVIRFRLSGVVSRLDMDHAQGAMADAIARRGVIKVLVLLDEFGGWQRGVDWGDLSFAQEHDAQIARSAVVGDPAWEEEVLTFMAAPLRSTEIRYFDRAHLDAANRWLVS